MRLKLKHLTWFGTKTLAIMVASFSFQLAPCFGQELPQLDKMEPVEAPRGATITFTGSKFPKKDNISIFLNSYEQKEYQSHPCYVNPQKTSFEFCIPSSISLGIYNVTVEFKLNETNKIRRTLKSPTNGTLDIYNESGKRNPKILGLYPLVSYPNKKVYAFDVLGEGFSKKESDNKLVIADREVPVCWKKGSSCKSNELTVVENDPKKVVYGEVISDRQLRFSNISGNEYKEPAAIKIRVGQNESEPSTQMLLLSSVGRLIPIILSSIGFLVLCVVLLIVLKRDITITINSPCGWVELFLVDRETNTYSLSRLQFFIWTGVTIFCYIYLVLSRILVQSTFQFLDIPAGLPIALLISASTSVLAHGITSLKGSKGAGNLKPGLSDLITTGGVVAPERFQFLVWTLVGAPVFLFLVLIQDPGAIKELPNVPTGFLELMGVSSLGYAGGKLARRVGPNINEIVYEKGNAQQELTIRGQNLSKDATFYVNKVDENNQLTSEYVVKREIKEKEDQTNQQDMAKVLQLTISPAGDTKWFSSSGSKHKVIIINPDGQKAEKEVTLQ